MTYGMGSSYGSTGSNAGQNMTGMKPLKEKIPSGYKAGALQQFTPEQMQLFQQLFSQVSPDSFLSKLAGGDQSQFAQMEAPAMRQFNELQGGLASRFSGMGAGSRRSSGFQNVQGQATSDFAQDLASRRQGLQRQALMDLMGISENLLGQRPFQRTLTEKPKSWWQSLLSSSAQGLGQGLGQAAGKSFGSAFSGESIPGLG